MLITLALLGTTLAPAQNGLKFEEARLTYGPLGQSRKKDDPILPGEHVFLSTAVKGLKSDKQGNVRYSLDFEVTREGVKEALIKNGPLPQEQLNWLGGDEVPLLADWRIPADDKAAGKYTMKLTCTDTETKKSVTLTKEFTVARTSFGFVETSLLGMPVAVAGQRTGLRYALVGYAFDKKTNKTDVTLTIRVLDDKDKPTVSEPKTQTVKEPADDAPVVLRFVPMPIELNRAGKYKLEVSATDNVKKATAKRVFDLTVVEVK